MLQVAEAKRYTPSKSSPDCAKFKYLRTLPLAASTGQPTQFQQLSLLLWLANVLGAGH